MPYFHPEKCVGINVHTKSSNIELQGFNLVSLPQPYYLICRMVGDTLLVSQWQGHHRQKCIGIFLVLLHLYCVGIPECTSFSYSSRRSLQPPLYNNLTSFEYHSEITQTNPIHLRPDGGYSPYTYGPFTNQQLTVLH